MNGIYVIGSIINYSEGGYVYSGDLLQYNDNIPEILSYIQAHFNNVELREENGTHILQCDHININVLALDQPAADMIKMRSEIGDVTLPETVTPKDFITYED